jgi:hypothetical protein
MSLLDKAHISFKTEQIFEHLGVHQYQYNLISFLEITTYNYYSIYPSQESENVQFTNLILEYYDKIFFLHIMPVSVASSSFL